MNSNQKRVEKSILTEKLTKKVLKYYFIIYFAVLLLLLLILIPLLIDRTSTKEGEYTAFIADQYEQALFSIQSHMQALESNTLLEHLLESYGDNPADKSTKALIEQELQAYTAAFSQVSFCMIESENGTKFQSFSNSSSIASDICEQDNGYQKLKHSSSFTYYSPIYPPEIFESSSNTLNSCYSVFSSKKILINGKKYFYTLFYNINAYILNSETIADGTFTGYGVYNRDNALMYCTSIPNIPQYMLESASSSDIFMNYRGIYNCTKINSYGWSIYTYSSWSLFFSDLYPVLGVVLLSYLLTPVFFRLFVVPLNTRYLYPLKTLTDKIKTYSAGDQMTTGIRTGDEIEMLSCSIDKMISKINTQIEDIKKQERENCETQYSLLATQIDPHFIYNTLNIINIMARQNNQPDIVAINTALGKILKERFSTKSSIFDTLENEIDTISQYCTIMKYRYKNYVQVNIEAESELFSTKIPKNILIPIVENAFYHGLSTDEGIIRGHLDISIYRINSKLIIEISDDGSGITKDKINYLKKNNFQSSDTDRTHIGLANVYERLYYLYQDKFTLDISGNPGCGTTCSITIPISKEIHEIC